MTLPRRTTLRPKIKAKQTLGRLGVTPLPLVLLILLLCLLHPYSDSFSPPPPTTRTILHIVLPPPPLPLPSPLQLPLRRLQTTSTTSRTLTPTHTPTPTTTTARRQRMPISYVFLIPPPKGTMTGLFPIRCFLLSSIRLKHVRIQDTTNIKGPQRVYVCVHVCISVCVCIYIYIDMRATYPNHNGNPFGDTTTGWTRGAVAREAAGCQGA